MFNFELFLSVFFAYFVVVDPLGVSLIFNSLVRNKTRQEINAIIFKAILLSVLLIIVFGFFGLKLLVYLGISIEAFRIAGGLLLFYSAFHMIIEPMSKLDKEEQNMSTQDITVFPLSIPLLAGPGSLTLSILQFSNLTDFSQDLFSVLLAIIAVFILTYIGLFFSSNVSKFIGKTINDIMNKLIGVLLASLSIQFIADGIIGFTNQ